MSMTVDETIARLQQLKTSNPSIDVGQAKLILRCPVPNEDCWLHEENVTVKSTPEDPNSIVVMEGGFGA